MVDVFEYPGQMKPGLLLSATTNAYEPGSKDSHTYKVYSAFVDDGDIAGLMTNISVALGGSVFP